MLLGGTFAFVQSHFHQSEFRRKKTTERGKKKEEEKKKGQQQQKLTG